MDALVWSGSEGCVVMGQRCHPVDLSVDISDRHLLSIYMRMTEPLWEKMALTLSSEDTGFQNATDDRSGRVGHRVLFIYIHANLLQMGS